MSHLDKAELSAQQVISKYGKTFALAAKLLSPASRESAIKLYAFARTVDDWVDMQATNPAVKRQIADLQKTVYADIQDLLNQHHIPNQVLQDFLQAQLNDDDGRTIESQQALIDYAYGVAGSIGRMMRPILQAPVQAELYATSLGIAMQLTNIARDVLEDASRARIYVPSHFFSAPISPQHIQNPNQQQAQIIFSAIVKLLHLADSYYAFARLGYPEIPLRNRLSIAAAGEMYQAIGKKILKRGQNKYWQRRVSIGFLPKMLIACAAIIKTIFNSVFNQPKSITTNAAIVKTIQHSIKAYQ